MEKDYEYIRELKKQREMEDIECFFDIKTRLFILACVVVMVALGIISMCIAG